MRIGYANCVRDGDRLVLADIHVLAELPYGRPTLLQRFQSLMGARPMPLRHQGIGSELSCDAFCAQRIQVVYVRRGEAGCLTPYNFSRPFLRGTNDTGLSFAIRIRNVCTVP